MLFFFFPLALLVLPEALLSPGASLRTLREGTVQQLHLSCRLALVLFHEFGDLVFLFVRTFASASPVFPLAVFLALRLESTSLSRLHFVQKICHVRHHGLGCRHLLHNGRSNIVDGDFRGAREVPRPQGLLEVQGDLPVRRLDHCFLVLLEPRRTNVVEKLEGLTDSSIVLGPSEKFREQMRKLEKVGKAAGLSTFEGAIRVLDNLLDLFNGVEAARLQKYMKTVIKSA